CNPAGFVASRIVCESFVYRRVFGLFIGPFAQTVPQADQAFMGDIDHRVGTKSLMCRRHQKRAPMTAEAIDYRYDCLLICLGDRANFAEPGRSADFAVVGSLF